MLPRHPRAVCCRRPPPAVQPSLRPLPQPRRPHSRAPPLPPLTHPRASLAPTPPPPLPSGPHQGVCASAALPSAPHQGVSASPTVSHKLYDKTRTTTISDVSSWERAVPEASATALVPAAAHPHRHRRPAPLTHAPHRSTQHAPLRPTPRTARCSSSLSSRSCPRRAPSAAAPCG